MSFKLNTFGTNSPFAPSTVFSSSVSSEGTGTGTAPVPILETGTNIDFKSRKIYNAPTAPSSDNFTDNLIGANLGVIQKIYHQNTVAPTFPAGWVKVTDGVYFPNQLNTIFAEWAGGTRVEYWVIQET